MGITATAADVGCVVASKGSVESVLASDEFGRASGLVCDVIHPMLGEHPRLTAAVKFSESASTPGPGCMVGQHTASVLREIGYRDAQIQQLFDMKVVGGDRPRTDDTAHPHEAGRK